MTPYQYFAREIVAALRSLQAAGQLPNDLDFSAITAEPPRDPAHGDISTNAAMVLAKAARNSPKAIADVLLQRLLKDKYVADGSVAGPGFINLKLKPELWQEHLRECLVKGDKYGDSDIGGKRLINVEYVSANPTGPLHVAHARGAIVGDVLANLLEKVGYKVQREYYVNDGGVQVDIFARSVFLRYLEDLGLELSTFPDEFYPGEYVRDIARNIRRNIGGLWWQIDWLEWSDPEHKKLYDQFKLVPPTVSDMRSLDRRLGYKREPGQHPSLRNVSVQLDGRPVPVGYGEWSWLPYFAYHAVKLMLVQIRRDLKQLRIGKQKFVSERQIIVTGKVQKAFNALDQKGLIYQGRLDPPKGQRPDDWEDREQTLFRSSQFGDDVDRPLKKSDGSWTYFANDIAYHYDKYRRGYKDMINVWGADHGGYVKRMKAAVGAMTEQKGDLDVKLCQLVRVLKGGELVRMSKRAGTFITLRDLLNEVGPDVLRFTMLTRKNDAPFDFDIDKATEQSRDNPVWYVQYAHARTNSVMRQAAETRISTSKLDEAALNRLVDAGEISLIRLVAQWPRQVEAAALAHEPHRIAFYLGDLAAAFHAHWTRGREEPNLRFVIADNPDLTRARLALVQGIHFVLRSGLNVFGVTPIEEMT
jgi:arginyl-tRNA synthetase